MGRMLRKAEEMEGSIAIRAARASWAYTLIFFIAWNIVILVQEGESGLIPFILLVSSGIVYYGSFLWIRRKMGCEDDQ